jgi:hypothetical protein
MAEKQSKRPVLHINRAKKSPKIPIFHPKIALFHQNGKKSGSGKKKKKKNNNNNNNKINKKKGPRTPCAARACAKSPRSCRSWVLLLKLGFWGAKFHRKWPKIDWKTGVFEAKRGVFCFFGRSEMGFFYVFFWRDKK